MRISPSLAELANVYGDQLPQDFLNPERRTVIESGTQFLFLCFTNRCGSNHLADLIQSTGMFNQPEEFFNLEPILDQAAEKDLQDMGAYLNHVSATYGKNSWFATKIGLWQLITLAHLGIIEEILDRSRFLVIERRDKVSQAISMAVAMQTQQWTSKDFARRSEEDLAYDRELITQMLKNIETQTRGFFDFFLENEIVHALIAYEAILAAPQASIDSIGKWLAVQGLKIDDCRLSLESQMSPLKRRWRVKYLAGD